MNKDQIWSVLECCLLVSGNADYQYLMNDCGFSPEIARAGINLHEFLKSKKLCVEELKWNVKDAKEKREFYGLG